MLVIILTKNIQQHFEHDIRFQFPENTMEQPHLFPKLAVLFYDKNSKNTQTPEQRNTFSPRLGREVVKQYCGTLHISQQVMPNILALILGRCVMSKQNLSTPLPPVKTYSVFRSEACVHKHLKIQGTFLRKRFTKGSH